MMQKREPLPDLKWLERLRKKAIILFHSVIQRNLSENNEIPRNIDANFAFSKKIELKLLKHAEKLIKQDKYCAFQPSILNIFFDDKCSVKEKLKSKKSATLQRKPKNSSSGGYDTLDTNQSFDNDMEGNLMHDETGVDYTSLQATEGEEILENISESVEDNDDNEGEVEGSEEQLPMKDDGSEDENDEEAVSSGSGSDFELSEDYSEDLQCDNNHEEEEDTTNVNVGSVDLKIKKRKDLSAMVKNKSRKSRHGGSTVAGAHCDSAATKQASKWKKKTEKAMKKTKEHVKIYQQILFRKLYCHQVRKMIHNLSLHKNHVIFHEIISSRMKIKQLLNSEPCEIAPWLYKNYFEKKLSEEQAKKNLEKWDETTEFGIFTCTRCRKNKTTYYQLQTRSADEPMTAFVTCLNCSKKWKA